MQQTGHRPIICGVDESPESRAAAFFAASLAARLDTPFVLAHISSEPPIAVPSTVPAAVVGSVSPQDVAQARAAAHDDGRLLLNEIARDLPVEPTLDVSTGSSVEGLQSVVDQWNAQLIVVGAHQRGALARATLRTAWCHLATDDRCPVVVVSSQADVSCEGPIVAAYDGSDHSVDALLSAATLAARLGERVVAVSVGKDGRHAALDRTIQMRLRDAATISVDSDGGTGLPVDVQHVFLHGSPEAEIELVADTEDAALIVTGSRGRGPWRSAFLGSVSARIVEVATRPVMIVPPGGPR